MYKLFTAGALLFSASFSALSGQVDIRPDLEGILSAERSATGLVKRVRREPQLKTLEYLVCYRFTEDKEWYNAAKRHFENGLEYSDTDDILERVQRFRVFKKYAYRLRKEYNRASFFGGGLCGREKLEATKF